MGCQKMRQIEAVRMVVESSRGHCHSLRYGCFLWRVKLARKKSLAGYGCALGGAGSGGVAVGRVDGVSKDALGQGGSDGGRIVTRPLPLAELWLLWYRVQFWQN
jgi:hypothetical protein